MPDKWRGITVRHLLTHTAGLASGSMGFAALAIPGGPRADVSTTLMFDAAMKDPMSFAPGTSWRYSDVGYFLLGMIIEKASGWRYREFVSERLFRPLGMAATFVPDRWVIVKNRAVGYTLRDGQVAQIRRDTQTELPSHVGGLLNREGPGHVGWRTGGWQGGQAVDPRPDVDPGHAGR